MNEEEKKIVAIYLKKQIDDLLKQITCLLDRLYDLDPDQKFYTLDESERAIYNYSDRIRFE